MHINNIGLPCYLRAHDRACDFTATPRRPYIEIKKKKENWKGRKIGRLIVHLSAGDIYIYIYKFAKSWMYYTDKVDVNYVEWKGFFIFERLYQNF